MSEPWGYSLAMDLKDCDQTTIRSRERIQEYVIRLCKLIDVKRHGDCHIVHFGDGVKEGYTMMQLLETSNLVGHFDNSINSAFIDIFTTKNIDFNTVIAFSMEFFEADEVTTHTAVRGEYNG